MRNPNVDGYSFPCPNCEGAGCKRCNWEGTVNRGSRDEPEEVRYHDSRITE